MEGFNVEKARELVDSFHIEELHNILTDIKIEAEEGETFLHIYKNLKDKTVQELISRGFRVNSLLPLSPFGEKTIHFSVHWD